jgi:16S rRNA (uracil1498-N3)-methyltransferase
MSRLSRIFTSRSLTVGETILLDERAGHYIARVLRLSVGDTLILFNGDSNDYGVRVSEIQRQAVKVLVNTVAIPPTESPLKITLVQGISRGDRMDYCLQKATELGVNQIQPLLTRRVEVRMNQKKLVKRLTHWRQVIISACEQSGRAVIPEVSQPQTLTDWFAMESTAVRLVLDPTAEQKLTNYSLNSTEISILIGPEGGFEQSELDQAQAAGCSAVSLGPRVLRTESAGPVAIAVLQSMAGDF